ncbi:MAG TPA: hypothetical protein ENI20_12995 [Bacteroides sp.]|nr:hypothetical protein [Bacteroides sp.]
MKFNQIIQNTILFCIVVLLSTACESKTEEEEEHLEQIEIEFSYTPDPATVGASIHFKFEPAIVSEDGHHEETPAEISMVTCEIGAEAGGEHHEMMLDMEDGHGHYEGEWTFNDPGHYEIHFGYMYGEEMHEKEFTLEVVQN